MKLPGGSAVLLVALLVATSAIAPGVVARPAEQSAPEAKPDAGVTQSSITADPPASVPVDPSVSTASVRSKNTPAVETAADNNIHQQTTLLLTPDQPGQVGARTQYELPGTVQSLTVRVPEAATVRRADGFSADDNRTYAWDKTTSSPRLVYDFAANRTVAGARSPERQTPLTESPRESSGAKQGAQTGSYSFVDVGPWAITQVPSMGVSWTYTETQAVELRKSTAIDGQGATGDEIAFLGPLTEYTRTAHGQQFRLAVPQAASLRESPADVLDALANASGRLVVGERDETVFFIAAPTGPDWGPLGIEYGGSDVWVRADARLDRVTNVWLHEYVHTRQSYDPTEATRWSQEGAADYYAALLTFEQGRITFETFRDRLRRGTADPAARSVLADPNTWEHNANYRKGALVWGLIDYRIRTVGDRSVDNVLARLNAHGEPVTATVLLDAVGTAGTGDVRATASRYTETSDAPDSWSREAHSRAFSGPDIRALLAEATYRVSGPYREAAVGPNRSLVTNETLTVSVPVQNVGDKQGVSEVEIRSAGQPVVSERVEIPAGERRTITLQTRLNKSGTSVLHTDSGSARFTVNTPSPVTVRDLRVQPGTVTPGESASVSLVVENNAEFPADGVVELIGGGEELGSERVRLGVDEQTTLSFSVRFETPGVRTLQVRQESVALRVREPTSTAENGSLSVVLSVIAVLFAMVLVRRRKQR